MTGLHGTRYGATSLARIDTLHPALQRVVLRVGEVWDCSVLCGYRSPEEQAAALAAGKSRAKPGESPHNYRPALAVDLWPYPVDWVDLDRARVFAGYVLGVAAVFRVPLTWGGDWHRELWDRASTDRPKHAAVGLDDMPHFELHDWRVLAKKQSPGQ